MLTKATEAGIIRGLVPNLVEGGLTHLQYADDTVIFLEFSTENLQNIKLILSCYDVMLGMKINFEKSEVFTVGLEESDQQEVINILNCKIGTFPRYASQHSKNYQGTVEICE